MLRPNRLSLALAALALAAPGVYASTAYGDLNNFDTVNDTGQECHGFEIELDGVRSTDITYTSTGTTTARRRSARTSPIRPCPRCSSATRAVKNPRWHVGGLYRRPGRAAHTTDGHSCTDPP
jgi:hypothetical protein